MKEKKQILLFLSILLSIHATITPSLIKSKNTLTVSGTLIDKKSKKHLPGASIILDKNIFYTNQDGQFNIITNINLRLINANKTKNTHKITFSIHYYGYYSSKVTLNIGKLSQAEGLSLSLDPIEDPSLLSVEVSAERERSKISRQTIDKKEVSSISASNGDLIRTILTALPGVAVLNKGAAADGYSVRGGDPYENIIYIDGLPVKDAFHFGGYFSVFHSRSIENVDFYAGPFPSEFGNMLSSVLDIRTISTQFIKWETFFDASLFTASTFIQGPIRDNLSIMLGFRRSYFGLIAGHALNVDNLPYFWDYYAKISLRISKQNFLDLSGIGAYNDYNALDERFYSRFFSQGITWRFIANDRIRNFLTFGWMWSDTEHLFGKDPSTEKTYHSSEKSNRFFLRERIEIGFSDDWEVILGGHLSYDYNPFKKIFPLLEHTATPLIDIEAILQTLQSHLFANLIYRNKDYGLKITAGGALSHFNITNTFSFSPQISTEWFFIPSTAFLSGIGISFQSPQNYKITESTKGLKNPMVSLITSGFLHQFSSSLHLKVEGYAKYYRNIVTPDKNTDNPKVLTHFNNSGRGFASGAEVILRKRLRDGLFAWLTYSISFAKRADHPTEALSWAAGDHRHIVSAIFSWKLNDSLAISGKWRLNSGRRITPLTGRQHLNPYAKPETQWTGKAGMPFSETLPRAHQLDFRVEYTIGLSFFKNHTITTTFYIEFTNAYGQEIVTDYLYNDIYSDFDRPKSATGLPGLAMAGLFMKF